MRLPTIPNPMKNFQVNLFIVLAIGLCSLCAWQWYEQTVQRTEIQTLNRIVYDRDAAIQGYTNSIATLNHQVNQMDMRITEIKAARNERTTYCFAKGPNRATAIRQ